MFEWVKDVIEEIYDNSDMAPIIESLFSEVAILGFLSSFTFAFIKLGVLSPAAKLVLGSDDEHDLIEMFEEVHYTLFLSCCFTFCFC